MIFIFGPIKKEKSMRIKRSVFFMSEMCFMLLWGEISAVNKMVVGTFLFAHCWFTKNSMIRCFLESPSLKLIE